MSDDVTTRRHWRMDTRFPSQPSIQSLLAQHGPGGPYAFIVLLCDAYTEFWLGGKPGQSSMTLGELARLANLPEAKSAAVILLSLRRLGLVELDLDAKSLESSANPELVRFRITFPKWDNWTPKDPTAADRKARSRAKQAANKDPFVDLSRPVTDGHVEESREEENSPNSGSEARKVFEYWAKVMGHEKARCGADRIRHINARLRDGYSVDDLKAAIDGCASSNWHMGQNPQRKTYHELSRIVANSEQVEKFMTMKAKPKSTADDFFKRMDQNG